jgi:uncharacterized protein (DUF1501 family)
MNRRDFVRIGACSAMGVSVSGWLSRLAAETATNPQRRRSCILLWMNGGPSQIDTFDPKPGHPNGGPFKPVQTSVPGLMFNEPFPNLAKHAQHLAVIRSMATKEGDHGRATYLMRTGTLPQGAIQYPFIGSLLAKELSPPNAELPDVVSIAPFRFFNQAAFGPGFLGPKYAPLFIGESNFGQQNQPANFYEQALRVADMDRHADVSREQHDARVGLLQDMEKNFLEGRADAPALSHQSAYERAVRLMKSESARAFKLDEEPDKLRDRYGRNLFGQGCLLARRLVERGVPFVEVTLANAPMAPGGWDTHANNFEAVKSLCSMLDPAWATLMDDLKQRGLLDTTMVVWMGEFGRTPKLRGNGRDHFPNAWSVVVGGGGIKGGQAVGKTSADGTTVEERPVAVPDLLATVCKGLGIDPMKQNLSNVGRPIRIVDKSARPITEILS